MLVKEGGKALLIADDVIETRAYNEESADVTWESCALRSYLNGDFLNGFDDNQKRAIAEVKNSNPDNPEHGAPGGNGTTDKVFCLSIEEANKCFSSDADRIAKYGGKSSLWWLRSPGHSAEYAAYVTDDGDVDQWGFYVDNAYQGVRPAVWVKL